MKKYKMALVAACCIALPTVAQTNISIEKSETSRSLPFLELNADARTAAMGNADLAITQAAMGVFSNPAAGFYTTTEAQKRKLNYYAGYSFQTLSGNTNGRFGMHAVALGIKLNNKHLLTVGYRYAGGYKVDLMKETTTKPTTYKPFDVAVDAAYALSITPHLAAYVGGSFVHSYVYYAANAYSVKLGAQYCNSFSLNNQEARWMVHANATNWGTQIKYGNATAQNLPSAMAVGGEVQLPLATNHQVNVALTARHFAYPKDAQETQCGLGAEYVLFKTVALRGGYTTGKTPFTTAGLGITYKGIELNAACALTSDSRFNRWMAALSFNL